MLGNFIFTSFLSCAYKSKEIENKETDKEVENHVPEEEHINSIILDSSESKNDSKDLKSKKNLKKPKQKQDKEQIIEPPETKDASEIASVKRTNERDIDHCDAICKKRDICLRDNCIDYIWCAIHCRKIFDVEYFCEPDIPLHEPSLRKTMRPFLPYDRFAANSNDRISITIGNLEQIDASYVERTSDAEKRLVGSVKELLLAKAQYIDSEDILCMERDQRRERSLQLLLEHLPDAETRTLLENENRLPKDIIIKILEDLKWAIFLKYIPEHKNEVEEKMAEEKESKPQTLWQKWLSWFKR